MAAIMLITGSVMMVPETRTQVTTALASAAGAATTTINGVQTTIRSAAVIAVADDINGLVFQPPIPDTA